jgi:hypothetical protein
MSQITGPVFDIFGGQTSDGESGWRQAVNQSLVKIDAVISLSVINADQQQDPTSPAAGDRYIVAPSATGTYFTGHDKEVAVYTYSPNGTLGWVFYAPINGLKAFSVSDSATYIYDSATVSWVVVPSTAGSFEIPNVGEFSGAYVANQSAGTVQVDSFDKTIYGACEYLIYVKRPSTTYKQVSKFIVTHNDDVTTQLVDYAKIYSDPSVPLATFSSTISGNNVRLFATLTYVSTIRVMKILVNI